MSNILNKKTSSGPPAWGLGKVLTTPHHKILRCYGTFYKAREWSDTLEWYKQWERDMC